MSGLFVKVVIKQQIHGEVRQDGLHPLTNYCIINLMRNTIKDKRIKFAIVDYYGPAISSDISIEKILRHIAGRKLMPLTEDLKSDIFAIKINLQDSIYMGSSI